MNELILLLLPLVLVEIGLMVLALIDLAKRPRVRGGRKWVWGLVVVLFGIIGPIAYFLAGRGED